MRNYELMCIFPGTLAEDELPARIEAVKTTATENGAENISVKNMGKSRLAYPMKHIRYGYFSLFHFAADPAQMKAFEQKLRLSGDVLRFVFRTYDPAVQEQLEKNMVESAEKNVTAATQEEAEIPVQPEEKPKKEVKKEPETEEKKSMEDIDKRLDEILDQSISNI